MTYNEKRALYERVMKEISVEVKRQINESGSVNEGLFGFGDPSKPDHAWTAEYIREHSSEEIAELFQQYAIYIMAKCDQNANKAVAAFIEKTKEAWASTKEDAETQKKVLVGIIKSIRESIAQSYASTKKFAAAIPGAIVFGIATLVKLGVSGWDMAKNALAKAYSIVATFLKETYEKISGKVGAAKEDAAEKFEALKDTINLFMKVAGAAIILVAGGIYGAANAFGSFVSKILADAKEKMLFAVGVVKTWFSAKATLVADWAEETYGSVKRLCEQVWDSVSSAVSKTWKNACGKIVDFLNSVKATMEAIGEKIADVAASVKKGAISLKDASAAKIISTTVKALNKENYPLDKVIDLVTKAYNESLFISNSQVMLNESMFKNKARRYVYALND
jgi:phage-related protein